MDYWAKKNCTIVAQIYEKTATLVAPQVLLTYFMLGLGLSLLWALKSLKMQSLMLFFKIKMTMNTSEDKRSSPEPMNQTGV
jgi:flagellar biosynthesis protein FliQ